ncbi:MAG: hypothetical protein J6Z15_03875 [Oscillospiraceae bacterium]|nr:hypothetical protein [Oscillospiraceae bacterium]
MTPHSKMIPIRKAFALILTFACVTLLLSGCTSVPKKTALRAIIIPKFEVGDMSGDFPGEAQLFYEAYCPGCAEVEVPHLPSSGHFYVNEENGVGILVTGSGKTAAGLSLMAVLSSERYDCSDAYLVSVGCAGGSAAICSPGDVILITAICDYDLGHHVDAHERKRSETRVMWFADDSYADYEYKVLNAPLCEAVYDRIKDCPLRTTEEAKAVMAENFAARDEEEILPTVRKGTALSGDNYWKGIYGHATANFIANYYRCPDPYSATEMEEIAVANTAACFDMMDRLVSMRVIVNMDVFLNGETPESTWGEYSGFNQKIETENSETLDIFEPAMHNLFDTASLVVDAILSGEMQAAA